MPQSHKDVSKDGSHDALSWLPSLAFRGIGTLSGLSYYGVFCHSGAVVAMVIEYWYNEGTGDCLYNKKRLL